MNTSPLDVRRLGVVPYAEAVELQKFLVEERRHARIPDTLLLLQHPHVLTVGVKRDGGRANIVASADELANRDVEVFETGRGGDVTYHGAGQIVGYPIIDLNPDRRDVHRYVRDLEEMMIRVCAGYGILSGRIAGLSGTWVNTHHPADRTERRDFAPADPAAKIGAIGVRISRWITSHGFAFNVNTDLDYFNLIIPCGIADKGVTSLQALLGRPLDITDVEQALVREFAAVFGRDPRF